MSSINHSDDYDFLSRKKIRVISVFLSLEMCLAYVNIKTILLIQSKHVFGKPGAHNFI